MQTIEIQTLVDITDTRVARPNQGTQLQLDQNRNFVTLKQCVEIRSIISYDVSPTMEMLDIKDMGFGAKFKGKQAVWTFRFSPDRTGVYSDGVTEAGCLTEDVHGVPVIKKLNETINIDMAIFDVTDSQYKNTTIKVLKNLT